LRERNWRNSKLDSKRQSDVVATKETQLMILTGECTLGLMMSKALQSALNVEIQCVPVSMTMTCGGAMIVL
jgi:hypothetical protein